jgi:O-antigen/teichoic acid export membrane protein
MNSKQFIKAQVLVLLISNFSSVASYLSQMVLGRSLTPSEFGEFNSLNSLGVFILTPFSILQFLGTKSIAEYSDNLSTQLSEYKSLMRVTRTITILFFGLVIGFSPIIKSFLHLNSYIPIFGLALLTLTSCYFGTLSGVLSGISKYIESTWITAANFLVRLLITAVAIGFLKLSYVWGFVALFGGNVLSIIWSKRLLNAHFKGIGPSTHFDSISLWRFLKQSWVVVAFFVYVNAFQNLDLVFAKHFLDSNTAGIYSAAALIGRIASYIPMTMVHVLIPESAKAKGNVKASLKILALSLLLTLFSSGLFVFATYLSPKFFISIFVGGKFDEAAPFVAPIGLMLVLSTLSQMVIQYLLSRDNKMTLIPLILGTFCTLVPLFGFGVADLNTLIHYFTLGSLVTLITSCFLIPSTLKQQSS